MRELERRLEYYMQVARESVFYKIPFEQKPKPGRGVGVKVSFMCYDWSTAAQVFGQI